MFKKLLSMLLLCVMVLTIVVPVSAADFAQKDNAQNAFGAGDFEIASAELDQAAELFGFDAVTEDGYTLEKIVVSYARADEEVPNNGPVINAIGDYVSDVSKSRSDVYFPNSPISSNWFDGPLTSIEQTYSQSFTGTATCSVSVSNSVVEAGVGFSITTQISKSTTATRPAITSTQKLNIKEFGVFDEYSFNLYNIFGTKKGSGYAYKPMGLYIAQAVYVK